MDPKDKHKMQSPKANLRPIASEIHPKKREPNSIPRKSKLKATPAVKKDTGTFNNYVDMKGWVGGQSNVYAHKVNDLFLFTSIVYKGWVGGQKSPKFCLRSY